MVPTNRSAGLRVLPYMLAGIVIFAIGAWTMHLGSRMPYSDDDLMNMYRAWTMPLGKLLLANVTFYPSGYRPFGAAVYRAVYWAAGFHSQPLHWVVWSVVIVNLF